MDKPGGQYAKWRESGTERQVLHVLTHVEGKKLISHEWRVERWSLEARDKGESADGGRVDNRY